jgi:hypothetical protein
MELFSLPLSILLLDSAFKQRVYLGLTDFKIDGQKWKGKENKFCDIMQKFFF